MTDLDSHSDTRPPPEPPARVEVEQTGSSPIRLVMLAVGTAVVGYLGGLPILVMILAILVMIFLHELGHYLTAKWAGMKVTEFFIGFGPRIWSFHRGETEYGLKAIPAGAYVKVIGMTRLEEVDPDEEHRTYRSKPFWRRLSVAVAGSTMHFILALGCLWVFLAAFGEPVDGPWSVQEAVVYEDGTPGPAAAAGVQSGDVITAIDGQTVDEWGDLVEIIAERQAGDEVALQVDRDGQVLDLSAELGRADDGRVVLGVVRGGEVVRERLGPVEAVGRSATEFWDVSTMTVQAIGQVFSPGGLSNLANLAVDTARSPADDPVAGSGTAAPSTGSGSDPNDGRVMSIWGIVVLGGDLITEDPAAALALFALINIFIGIFNLVPLLPLDGGHVVIAVYEKGREVLSRSRDRYYADVGKLIPLTYAVIFVLVGVGLIALYLDIADPIKL
ncbi:MAG: M50 family metallopeptidase [Acidimicrobiales bacterium]